MAHLSVVIPVYQAEAFLPELYRRLKGSLTRITKDHEIVFVEDCGGDRSWEILSDLAKRDRRVKAIHFTRNFGQHYAITAGLDRCQGDWVVVMDCDLQDQPEEIVKLYTEARKGFDVVLGSRIDRQDGAVKRAMSWIFYRIFNFFTGLNYDGKVGNFCVISSKVLVAYRSIHERMRFFGGMLAWMGFPTSTVGVRHGPSSRGRSSYTYWKLSKLAMEAIISHSDKPLWLAVRAGFTLAMVSFLAGIFVVCKAMIKGIPIMGWASLIVSIYFLSGVIIGILGIVGVYVGKTFDETKRRPLYVVRETRNLPK